MLVDAARCIAIKFGYEANVHGVPGPAIVFRQSSLQILFRTPKTMAISAIGNYSIDIWFDNRKVFSACWNSNIIKDVEGITLNRGPWIPSLLEIAIRAETTVST